MDKHFSTFYKDCQPVEMENEENNLPYSYTNETVVLVEGYISEFLDSDSDYGEFSIEVRYENGEKTERRYNMVKSIINVKTAANMYAQYVIAVVDNWPTTKGKWLRKVQPDYSVNPKQVVMPNEVLTCNYSSDKHIPLGYCVIEYHPSEEKI